MLKIFNFGRQIVIFNVFYDNAAPPQNHPPSFYNPGDNNPGNDVNSVNSGNNGNKLLAVAIRPESVGASSINQNQVQSDLPSIAEVQSMDHNLQQPVQQQVGPPQQEVYNLQAQVDHTVTDHHHHHHHHHHHITEKEENEAAAAAQHQNQPEGFYMYENQDQPVGTMNPNLIQSVEPNNFIIDPNIINTNLDQNNHLIITHPLNHLIHENLHNLHNHNILISNPLAQPQLEIKQENMPNLQNIPIMTNSNMPTSSQNGNNGQNLMNNQLPNNQLHLESSIKQENVQQLTNPSKNSKHNSPQAKKPKRKKLSKKERVLQLAREQEAQLMQRHEGSGQNQQNLPPTIENMSNSQPQAVTMENCGLNYTTIEEGVQVVNDAGIRLELQGAQLWRMFYELGTEMIITKVGRRMFPAIRVKVSGLAPEKRYFMALDIMPVDENRYRYVYHSSKWMVAGTGDSPLPPRSFIHPESPSSGDQWMRQVVTFDKLKLTNHENDSSGHVSVNYKK